MAANIINLEKDMPTVEAALMRLRLELSTLRRTGISTIKIIHGYGSSGTGGAIRTATRQFLSEQLRRARSKLIVRVRLSAHLKTPAATLSIWRLPCARIPTGVPATMV